MFENQQRTFSFAKKLYCILSVLNGCKGEYGLTLVFNLSHIVGCVGIFWMTSPWDFGVLDGWPTIPPWRMGLRMVTPSTLQMLSAASERSSLGFAQGIESSGCVATWGEPLFVGAFPY